MSAHILDSSAIIECLDDGPNTRHFAPILRKLPDLIIPTVVITEVRKITLQQRSSSEAEAVTRSLLAGVVIPIDAGVATKAADLFMKHGLPLADSFIYAIALIHKATLWTQDADFKGLPQVKYFPKIKS